MPDGEDGEDDEDAVSKEQEELRNQYLASYSGNAEDDGRGAAMHIVNHTKKGKIIRGRQLIMFRQV